MKEKSQRRDKSPYRRNASGHVIKIKHSVGADSGDVMTYVKFCLNRLGGFGSGRTVRQKYNTALHYCACVISVITDDKQER
jgi:hypothetical protein